MTIVKVIILSVYIISSTHTIFLNDLNIKQVLINNYFPNCIIDKPIKLTLEKIKLNDNTNNNNAKTLLNYNVTVTTKETKHFKEPNI